MTAGARLRQRREAKGLSLEEVSHATKIHVNVLTLIETDQAAASVNPIYLKGFIKTYGGYLGEDVPALLAMLSLPPSAPAQIRPPTARQTSPPPLTSRAAAAVARAFGGGFQRLPWRRLAAGVVVVALVWAGGARIRSAMRHRERMSAASSSAAKTPTKPQLKRTAQARTTPVTAPLPAPRAARQAGATSAPKKKAPAAPAAPAAGEQVRLTVHVHATSWMRVTADGVIVAQQVLEPGARETWLARKEIILWLGDAGGVSLELNGRPLGAPGKRGEIVRALRITSAGIQR